MGSLEYVGCEDWYLDRVGWYGSLSSFWGLCAVFLLISSTFMGKLSSGGYWMSCWWIAFTCRHIIGQYADRPLGGR